MNVKLSMLINALSDVSVKNFYEQEITGISANSESVNAGFIFVAIKGARMDGNDFIDDAYECGARVFVISKKSSQIKDAVCIYSKTPRKTLAELCARFFENPQKSMEIIGITGTKGKTTTSIILSKILDGAGLKNIVIGTLGAISDKHKETQNTTPDPIVLFPLLKEAKEAGTQVAVLEVSSQALKDFRVWGINFSCVAFTGIGRDHVGGVEHPTFLDYVTSKRRLFSDYGAKSAVVNFDDPYSLYMSFDVPKVIKCGFSENADLVIKDFKDSPHGAKFFLEGVRVKSSLPGKYNAKNTAMAIALAREICGISISEAVHYVSGVKVAGRFERKVVNGKNIIVDYAHNAESFREVMTLCRRLFHGRIICVFGSVGDRSYARREELALSAEEYADFSVITSDNPGYEFPLSICADIYSAFRDKTKAKIIVSRGEAILYALTEAKPGDTVLLLGKGHETVMNIGGKAIPFSDSDIINRKIFTLTHGS